MEWKTRYLMKSDPSEQSLKLIEAYAPDIDYMPIFMEEDHASEKIEKMKIQLCRGRTCV